MNDCSVLEPYCYFSIRQPFSQYSIVRSQHFIFYEHAMHSMIRTYRILSNSQSFLFKFGSVRYCTVLVAYKCIIMYTVLKYSNLNYTCYNSRVPYHTGNVKMAIVTFVAHIQICLQQVNLQLCIPYKIYTCMVHLLSQNDQEHRHTQTYLF